MIFQPKLAINRQICVGNYIKLLFPKLYRSKSPKNVTILCWNQGVIISFAISLFGFRMASKQARVGAELPNNELLPLNNRYRRDNPTKLRGVIDFYTKPDGSRLKLF